MQRGTLYDLEAEELGFIENFECSLTLKLQGECDDTYCQPLLGFGDKSKYFIASYLIEHLSNESRVYPDHGVMYDLAEGDITSILTNYSGPEVRRDDQFYDAVTGVTTANGQGLAAFTSFEGRHVQNVWPIILKIRQNISGVIVHLGDGTGYWSDSFSTNTTLHFGILDQLAREDLSSNFGGFTMPFILMSRTCTEISESVSDEPAKLLSTLFALQDVTHVSRPLEVLSNFFQSKELYMHFHALCRKR